MPDARNTSNTRATWGASWEDQYGAVSAKRDLLSPAVKDGIVLLCFKRGEVLWNIHAIWNTAVFFLFVQWNFGLCRDWLLLIHYHDIERVKVKVTLKQTMKAKSRGVILPFFIIRARCGGRWSMSRPGRFTPGKETRYHSYRRLGGPAGAFWTCAENLAPIRFQSPGPSCP